MRFLSTILIFNLVYGSFAFVIRSDKDLKIDKNAVRNKTKELNTFSPVSNKFGTFGNSVQCPPKAKCVPPVQCPAHVKMLNKPEMCDLPGSDQSHGICCTTGQNHTDSNYFHKMEGRSRAELIQAIQHIINDADGIFKSMREQEDKHRHARIEPNSPSFFHSKIFGDVDPDNAARLVSFGQQGVRQILASRIFKENQQLSVEESQLDNFVDGNIRGTTLDSTCLARIKCPDHLLRSPYRQPDGFCNHVKNNGDFGGANTAMSRMLPPAYRDGIWEPRMFSDDGMKLKSARLISLNLFPDNDRPHPTLNQLMVQFGQFLSHDILQTSVFKLPDGASISCCTEDGQRPLPSHALHFACMPILISESDEFYSHFSQGCMNFVRSSLVPSRDCRFGYAKVPSKVTHFIDGSAIYGSDLKVQMEMRSFQGGLLKASSDFNREMLPRSSDPDKCLNKGPMCFSAGDARVNQNLALVGMHLIFAREHNRIAKMLGFLNPMWNDETLFQESRKIVIAELQHITYNEWLPLLLGTSTMEKFSLGVTKQGFSFDYDDDVNPSMTLEFSGAAFRFGHSAIQGKYTLRRPNNDIDEVALPDTFFNPSLMRFREFFDDLMLSLGEVPMQSVDNSVSVGLSRFLFSGVKPFGFDLISFNIQRGRDLALRPYNDYLELAGFRRIQDFSELGSIGEKLARVYKSPDDIDLYVGGLLEVADPDSAVGPTFKNIIADQFSRIRKGDRYFYEHDAHINPGAFTERQLSEIKKISMARIICDNSDGINLHQQSPSAFVQRGILGNEPVACSSHAIPSIDLSAWKDENPFD